MEQYYKNLSNVVLQLNKCGLSSLKYFQYGRSIEYLKKAERLLQKQILISTKNNKINSLASVTYNNLACYYKKTKKPKVALAYLQKSLNLQITKINDWISTGSTHLNICAIYSSLNNHEQALCHATLALELLQIQQKDQTKESKCYWNFKMLCYFNKAIQQEHLKLYDKSIKSYLKAKEIALNNMLNNQQIANTCNQSIAKIEAYKQQRKINFPKIITKQKLQPYFSKQFLDRHRSNKNLRSNQKNSKEKKKSPEYRDQHRRFMSVIQVDNIPLKLKSIFKNNNKIIRTKTQANQNYAKLY